MKASVRIFTIILCTAVAVSACRRAPAEPEPARAEVPSPASVQSLLLSSSGTVIAAWTGEEIDATARPFGYGPEPSALLARTPGGLAFTPQTAQDHVALPFVSLAPAPGPRAVELVLSGASPVLSGCSASLQDQAFNALATVECGGAEERRAAAGVPADVTSVRVVFQSSGLAPVQLPGAVRLLEYRDR